jgi:predicted RNA-binding protein associated with RNAse of E/G family
MQKFRFQRIRKEIYEVEARDENQARGLVEDSICAFSKTEPWENYSDCSSVVLINKDTKWTQFTGTMEPYDIYRKAAGYYIINMEEEKAKEAIEEWISKPELWEPRN